MLALCRPILGTKNLDIDLDTSHSKIVWVCVISPLVPETLRHFLYIYFFSDIGMLAFSDFIESSMMLVVRGVVYITFHMG